jgi:heat shock protein HslJ
MSTQDGDRPMRLSFLSLAALAACVTPVLSDDISGVQWHLVGLDGHRFERSATLRFKGDSVTGKAPCNKYFARNTARLPDLALQGIGSTKMACPDLEAERVYLQALRTMQRVELDQGHLFLIGPEGRVMEFVTGPAPIEATCLSCAPKD